jgi:glycerol kinase
MNGYVMALDQGTTSSRAILFSGEGEAVARAQYPFAQHYPKPDGWSTMRRRSSKARFWP